MSESTSEEIADEEIIMRYVSKFDGDDSSISIDNFTLRTKVKDDGEIEKEEYISVTRQSLKSATEMLKIEIKSTKLPKKLKCCLSW